MIRSVPEKKQEDLHNVKADLACKLWETEVMENCGYLCQPSRLKSLIAVLTNILNLKLLYFKEPSSNKHVYKINTYIFHIFMYVTE